VRCSPFTACPFLAFVPQVACRKSKSQESWAFLSWVLAAAKSIAACSSFCFKLAIMQRPINANATFVKHRLRLFLGKFLGQERSICVIYTLPKIVLRGKWALNGRLFCLNCRMRLWTVHPKYLDPQGLVAAWREALLAQKVLRGLTKGYRHHPQLVRFQEHDEPVPAVAAFLAGLADEADSRGYKFDRSKIAKQRLAGRLKETDGQLFYEWAHLKRKLRARSPEVYRRFRNLDMPEPHPLFRIVPGKVREWEKTYLRRSAEAPPR
jgi:hypothetical protein